MMTEFRTRFATNWENARFRHCRIGKVTPKAAKIIWHTRSPYSGDAEWVEREMQRNREQAVELPNFVEFPPEYGIYDPKMLMMAMFAGVFVAAAVWHFG